MFARIKRNSWWILLVVGFVVGFAIWAAGAFLDQRIEGKVGNRLRVLETGIAEMKGQLTVLLARWTIESAAALPPQELSRKLPELKAALAIARENHLNIGAPDLLAIKTNLAFVSPTAPDFWPTTSEVISSLSRVLSKLPPYPGPPVPIGLPGWVDAQDSTFEKVSVLLHGAKNSTFRNCWVFFSPDAKLENVRFENCVFMIPVSQVPSPNLQRIGEKLLASDLHSVAISSG